MATTPTDVTTDDRPATVEETIKAMLVENTGTHFLDSGSAYGRHWEENQERPPWDCPRFLVHDDYVSMNIYHWLTEEAGLERDEYVRDRERTFEEFARSPAHESDAWLTCMQAFGTNHAARIEGSGVVVDDVDLRRGNSYNYQNPLSQVIQYVTWRERVGDEWLLLQIHNGCDVRGGYTRPRLFRLRDRFLVPHQLGFWCVDCEVALDEEGLTISDASRMFDADANQVTCPDCGDPMSIRPE